MNTDEGAQFTNTAFTDVLQQDRIQIVMDGKGCLLWYLGFWQLLGS